MGAISQDKIDFTGDKSYTLDVHRKNCDPFVFGPALAMDRIPGPVCFKVKFSSANFSP